MNAARVLFRLDPSIVVAERTEVGAPIEPRAPARPWPSWDRFPFGAAVAAGIPYIRDIAGPDDCANLVQIDDDGDSVVVDVEDL